jgi:DNA-binding transcriptional LysR family regulator
VALERRTHLFRFNDYSVVLQAAIEGQGVAMGWRHLVEPLDRRRACWCARCRRA